MGRTSLRIRLPGFSHDRIIRVIICEACKTEKISRANMNDIMIDIEWELWFEGEKSVVS